MKEIEIQLKSPFFLIEEENTYFVFDGGNGYLFKIDKLLWDILRLSKIYDLSNEKDKENMVECLAEEYKREDIKTAFTLLMENNQKGLLLNKGDIYKIYDKKYEQVSDQHKLHSLCLNISQQCNLQCKYCFGDSGNYGHENTIMSKETAKKCIDYWFDNIDKNKEIFTVSFFGGEPLINKEVLIYSVDYINKLLKNLEGKVNYIITTNGTIMDDEIIETFRDNEFDVSISIDGIRQIHDENRPYASGKGSFDDILRNIEKVKVKYDRVSSQITLTKRDIPFLKDAVKALWDAGVYEVYSNLVFDHEMGKYSYEDYAIYHKQIRELREITYDNLIKGKNEKYGSLVDIMRKIHKREVSTNCFFWNHIVGIFSARGNAYRCYRYVGNEEHKLGNIDDEYFSVFKNRLKKPVVEKCSECWAQLFCGDGCPYENYLYEGDINVPAEEWCSKNMISIEESLRLYTKLLINKPEVFNEIFNFDNIRSTNV